MKIGLVGLPGSGKTTIFSAVTGRSLAGDFGGAGKATLGVVKVPDERVDAMAVIYQPKKTTYAEILFSDLGSGGQAGIDRGALHAMREVDALCQVVRGFPDAMGEEADPEGEIMTLESETLFADLEIAEKRIERLAKDLSDPWELDLMKRVQAILEEEVSLRRRNFGDEEVKRLTGYGFLSLKPLLLVINVAEEALGEEVSPTLLAMAEERGLGMVALSGVVEAEVAQIEEEEQGEYLAALGLEESARDRFIRAAYDVVDLISMLTVGSDECRAWAIPRATFAPRAAGKIHSDLERGFIRAEVIHWRDLVELGSEARCREAAKLRVEGKEYAIQDGDVVHVLFNV